jgi:hypothetical protein
MLAVIDRLRLHASINAQVVGSIQYRLVALTLLSLPHKKSQNAYNIGSRHFACALAPPMLRRGGPAHCLPIAAVCCMDWHV